MIAQQYVCDLFEYKDGNLYWKKARNNAPDGSFAGSIGTHGYLKTKIDGKLYANHRIIFLMHNGYIPKYIDHIDGNKTNNKIENLRSASNAENQFNVGIRKDNKSGVKNVNFHKSSGKWRVDVTVNRKQHYFGLFEDLEFAELVAIEARNKLHKEFARHV